MGNVLVLYKYFTGTVIGGNVMLGFYTVFNRKDGQVGFAEAAYCACKFQV